MPSPSLWSAGSDAPVIPAVRAPSDIQHPFISPRSGRRRSRARRPAPRAVNFIAALTGLGLGATIALGLSAETWSAVNASGGWATAIGRLAGLIGAYLMLVVVLLAGRVPVVERTLGQDRLMRWHRLLAPWALVLIAVHGTLITIGYAQSAQTGVLHQFGVLIGSYPGILATTVAFGLLMAAGFTSARIARQPDALRDVVGRAPVHLPRARAVVLSPAGDRGIVRRAPARPDVVDGAVDHDGRHGAGL